MGEEVLLEAGQWIVLLKDGEWSIVKASNNDDYCDILHHCDVGIAGYACVGPQQEMCDGCDEEVPEKVTTIAALYNA